MAATTEIMQKAADSRLSRALTSKGTHLAAADVYTSAEGEFDLTLLHHAVAESNLAAVCALVTRADVDVNAVDAAGRTPLAMAISEDVSAALQKAGGKQVSPLHAAFYPLHAAVMAGDVDKVSALLAEGLSVDQADYAGLTPLHIAAGKGSAQLVQLLLDAHVCVAVAGRSGATPLAVAMEVQCAEVEVLLREVTGTGAETTLSRPRLPVDRASQAALKGASGLEPRGVAAMQAAWSLLTNQHKPRDSGRTVSSLGMAFFTLLFKEHPHLLDMFSFVRKDGKVVESDMERHAVRVLTTLGRLLELLDDFNKLASVSTGLVKRHIGYGVRLEHYNQVLSTLAAFLRSGLEGLGLWDDVQADAWTKLFTLIKGVATGVYGEASPDDEPKEARAKVAGAKASKAAHHEA